MFGRFGGVRLAGSPIRAASLGGLDVLVRCASLEVQFGLASLGGLDVCAERRLGKVQK